MILYDVCLFYNPSFGWALMECMDMLFVLKEQKSNLLFLSMCWSQIETEKENLLFEELQIFPTMAQRMSCVWIMSGVPY